MAFELILAGIFIKLTFWICRLKGRYRDNHKTSSSKYFWKKTWWKNGHICKEKGSENISFL